MRIGTNTNSVYEGGGGLCEIWWPRSWVLLHPEGGYRFPTFRGTVWHSPSRTTEVTLINSCQRGIGMLFLHCTSLQFPQGIVILFTLIPKHQQAFQTWYKPKGTSKGGVVCVITSKGSLWGWQVGRLPQAPLLRGAPRFRPKVVHKQETILRIMKKLNSCAKSRKLI
jgi:hypothetical protein